MRGYVSNLTSTEGGAQSRQPPQVVAMRQGERANNDGRHTSISEVLFIFLRTGLALLEMLVDNLGKLNHFGIWVLVCGGWVARVTSLSQFSRLSGSRDLSSNVPAKAGDCL